MVCARVRKVEGVASGWASPGEWEVGAWAAAVLLGAGEVVGRGVTSELYLRKITRYPKCNRVRLDYAMWSLNWPREFGS